MKVRCFYIAYVILFYASVFYIFFIIHYFYLIIIYNLFHLLVFIYIMFIYFCYFFHFPQLFIQSYINLSLILIYYKEIIAKKHLLYTDCYFYALFRVLVIFPKCFTTIYEESHQIYKRLLFLQHVAVKITFFARSSSQNRRLGITPPARFRDHTSEAITHKLVCNIRRDLLF